MPELLMLALRGRDVGQELTVEEALPGTIPVTFGSTTLGSLLLLWIQSGEWVDPNDMTHGRRLTFHTSSGLNCFAAGIRVGRHDGLWC